MARRAGIAVVATALLGAALAPVASATSPGTNGPIVWQSLTGTNGGGGTEIWIMDPDGSNKDALTDNAFHDERPVISADGSKITFMSLRATDESHEIYKMNVDGSGQTALTDNDDTDFEPSWSPDGSKVIFQRSSNGVPAGEVAGQDLWTVPVAGGAATNLTNTPLTGDECCAEYSPDGTKVAFTNAGNTDGDPTTETDENEIWVMNANGTSKVQLTDPTDTDDTQDLQPTWSPDGSQIAWMKFVGGAQQIWTMDADGSDQEALTTAGNYYSPTWSPDGSLIVAQLNSDIVTVDVDSPTTVANLTMSAVQDEYPSWAPAGGGGGAPDTKITKKPKDVIHKDKATYEFEAIPAAGATFKCKLDGKPFKPCESPKTYKNLDKGKHKFRVRASNADGTDPTPASDGFEVKP